MAKTANEDNTKKAALSLLRRGIVTKAEAAELAGISRQLMGYWSKGIPYARARYLARIWDRQVNRSQPP